MLLPVTTEDKMKLIPRDYQNEAVYSIYRYFDAYKAAAGNPLVVLPTGTGKSLVIAIFIELLLKWYAGQKVMMLTHVKELIEQNFSKLKAIWPEAPAGIYSSGLRKKDTLHPIIFAGIASVAKRAHEFGNVSIVMIDEAHLISPKQQTMYQKFLRELKEINPHLKVIGLTATPFRMGLGPIFRQEGDEELGIETMFDTVTFDGSSPSFFNWFINEGYLLPVVPKRTKMQLNVSGVKKQGGEFVASELQTVVNKREANEAAIAEAIEYGNDRKAWLIFCTGIDHAIDVANLLNEQGIPAAAIHSKMGDAERDQILKDFKSGKLRAVTNNNVLTTGFDHPGIDMIIMLRPTMSPILWVQMLGRGTRPDYMPGYDISDREQRLLAIQESTKHECLVLDFSGNSRRLGPINDPSVPKRPGDKGAGSAIYKSCEVCAVDGQPSAWRFCGGINPAENGGKAALTFCGAPFKFKEKLKKAAATIDLVKKDLPVIVDHEVCNIVYQKNVNRGDHSKPPTLKVTYHCGIATFHEFVCLMHGDWAGRKAYKWWKNRTSLPLPSTIDDALEIVSTLKVPTHIRVDTNNKFPEILNCCYDGSNFGTMEASSAEVGVQIYTKDSILSNKVEAGNVYDQDDAPMQLANHESYVDHNSVAELHLQRASSMPEDEDIVPF
jgi:DNA repair protein RadD